MSKRLMKAPVVTPTAPSASIKLHREQYLEVKLAVLEANSAQRDAQIAGEMAQTKYQAARALFVKLGIPEGRFGFDDAACTLTRLG